MKRMKAVVVELSILAVLFQVFPREVFACYGFNKFVLHIMTDFLPVCESKGVDTGADG